MTNIEKMAREAGAYFCKDDFGDVPEIEFPTHEALQRFAQAVAQRCAEICEAQEDYAVDVLICEASRRSAADCADAIRAEFGVTDEK